MKLPKAGPRPMRVHRATLQLMCDFPGCGTGGPPGPSVCRKLPTGIYLCL